MRVLLTFLLIALVASEESYIPGFLKNHFRRFDHRNKLLAESEKKPLPTQWFDQTMDHFSVTKADDPTWKQRFWVDDAFYKPGSPMFIQLGEEAAASSGYASGLQMANYGREHNALLVAIEHRFYGESQPTGDLKTESLRLLSVDQGIADFVEVIQALKKQYNVSKAVTFGCSYIGAGSAWLRMKYPHIVIGSIASSAPVRAVVDMVTYLDQVGLSIKEQFGAKCDADLTAATTAIAAAVKTPEGRMSLEKTFNTCGKITGSKDISNFFSSVISAVMGTVQYDFEQPGNNIPAMCKVIDSAQNPVEGLAEYSKDPSGQCMDISYDSMITQLRDTSIKNGIRSWLWQTCSEFGYYQSTDSKSQPFAPGNLVPVDFYTQMCNDMFQIDMDVYANVEQTNLKFGSNQLPSWSLTNVVFDNSVIDPWHTLSIQSNVSSSVPLFLYGTRGHCAAVSPSSPSDPQSITDMRNKIKAVLNGWIRSF